MTDFPLEGDQGKASWLRAHAREVGGAAIAPLRDVALRGSVPMRAAAVQALAELDAGGTEAFVLERARADVDREVREAATRALAAGTGEGSFAFLAGETDEERAARIALRTRLEKRPTPELVAFASRAERRLASVAIELLAARDAVDDVTEDVLGWLDASPPGDEENVSRVLEAIHDAALRGASRVVEALTARWLARAPARDVETELAWARLAVARDPRRVHDELAPLFGRDDASRENAVVRALAEQIDAAFHDDDLGVDDDTPPRGVVPDARWRETLATWEPSGDDVSFADLDAADALRQGLAWAHGPRGEGGPRRVSSGAEDGRPFVIAGFDVTDARFEEAAEELGARARGLHLFQHQCGGLACRQVHVAGIPLVSEALLSAFADGTRSRALLEPLAAGGEPTPERLAEARAVLEDGISLPILAGGTEAIVWTEPCRPLAWLAGFEVVRVVATGRPWLRSAEWEQIRVRRLGPFTAAHDAVLVELGERLGLGRPRLFVIWDNSD